MITRQPGFGIPPSLCCQYQEKKRKKHTAHFRFKLMAFTLEQYL